MIHESSSMFQEILWIPAYIGQTCMLMHAFLMLEQSSTNAKLNAFCEHSANVPRMFLEYSPNVRWIFHENAQLMVEHCSTKFFKLASASGVFHIPHCYNCSTVVTIFAFWCETGEIVLPFSATRSSILPSSQFSTHPWNPSWLGNSFVSSSSN